MRNGPRSHSSPTSPGAHAAPRVGIDDLRLEAGHGPAERPAPVLGLLGLVVAREADAAGLGHAEHVVAQLRIGGPDVAPA